MSTATALKIAPTFESTSAPAVQPQKRVVTNIYLGARRQLYQPTVVSMPANVIAALGARFQKQSEFDTELDRQARLAARVRENIEDLQKMADQQKAAAAERQSDMVSRTAVIRGASLVVGASTAVCWLGTVLSGTLFVHPLISALLIIGSVAFFAMSKLDK